MSPKRRENQYAAHIYSCSAVSTFVLKKWMEHQEPASFASVLHAAARTGFAGFFAMVLQVTLLMWIRTCMNYQYKHGGSLTVAFKVLYAQGGIRRFYSGYSIAVFQAPLGRFFDTAANSGVLALFLLYPAFDNVPTFVKSMAASATAASFKASHPHPSRILHLEHHN